MKKVYGLFISRVRLVFLICLILQCVGSFNTAFGQQFDWAVKAGGNSIDHGNSIVTDSLGNVYVTGHFKETATFGDYTIISSGESGGFIAKYNSKGVCQWAIKVGGSGCSITIDNSGYVYVTGYFSGTATFGDDTLLGPIGQFFIAKYNSDGIYQWAVKTGGRCESIITDNLGNLYLMGYLSEETIFGNDTLGSSGNYNNFIAKYNTNGICQWAISAGGLGQSFSGYSSSLTTDNLGNIYVAGHFYETVTFGNFTLVSLGNTDIFIAKYNTNGICQWAISAGGEEYDYGWSIATDNLGNIYLTGYFSGTATFENYTLVSSGVRDIFIAKYNTDGMCQWAKKAGGEGTDIGSGITTDNLGNIYLTGFINESATFGDYTLAGSDSSRYIFFAKYNSNGLCEWVINVFSGSSADISRGVTSDNLGNIYITGSFYETTTFENDTLINSGDADIFIAKYSVVQTSPDITICRGQGLNIYSTGANSYIWSNGDTSNTILVSPTTTSKYYVTGTYKNGSTGVDSITVNVISQQAVLMDMNITKSRVLCKGLPFDLNVEGGHIYQWSNGIKSQTVELLATKSAYYYVTVTDTTNCNYDIDSVYIKVINDCSVNGQVYYDFNKNQKWDYYEKGLEGIKIKISPGGYGITDKYGKFIANPAKTNCDVSLVLDENSIWDLSSTPASFNLNMDDTNSSTNVLFGLKAKKLFQEFDINIASDIHRNGRAVNHYVSLKNKGTTIGITKVSYLFDPSVLTFVSCDKCENLTIDGNTITFNTDSIYLNESRLFRLEFMVKQGTTGHQVATEACMHDSYFGNWNLKSLRTKMNCEKFKTISEAVRASYDPNDKQAKWTGIEVGKKYVGDDKLLEYTIRFQNTGNDTAFDIWIADTLSPLHDYSTLDVLASSHDVITLLDSNGVLKFFYYDIMLPDSNINEKLSHGFVMFRIKLQDTISECTEIRNKGGIFFDFNEPVITNETSVVYSTLFAYAGNDTTIMFGDEISLTANSGNNYRYTWNYSRNSNEQSITVSPTETTTYLLTVSDNKTCLDTHSVVVSLKNNLNTSKDLHICMGGETTLTATGSAYYLWSNDSVGSEIIVSPTLTTTYYVTGVVGEDSATDRVIVYVDNPIADAGIDKSICFGKSVVLNATGANSYLWSNNDTSSSINVSPTATATYYVAGWVGNCSDIDTVVVTVNPNPIVNIDVLGSEHVCVGANVQLNATGANSYIWSNNSVGSEINVSPTSTTTYYVTGIINACVGTNEKVLFVNPLDSVYTFAVIEKVVNNPNSITLVAVSGMDNLSYLWSTGATTDSINLEILNTATSSYTVTITHIPTNCYAAASTIITSLSYLELIEQSLNIYPVPASDLLYIKFNQLSPSPLNIKITDMTGREVYYETIRTNDTFVNRSIKTSVLANGVYTLQIQSKEGNINRKLIIGN